MSRRIALRVRAFYLASAVILTVGSASACASPGKSADAADVEDVTTARPVVRLERRGCLGNCPSYSLELYPKGTVVFNGTGGRAPRGRRTASVPAADVKKLTEQFTTLNFVSIAPEWSAKSSGCAPYAADAPIVVLTLWTARSRHSVMHDHGCSGAPDALNALEMAVDSVGRVQRWIPTTGEAK